MNLHRASALAVVTLCAAGCTLVGPRYSPSLENVQAIKDAGAPKAKVGAFASTPDLDRIVLRATPMASPIDGSYGAYLADALRQELDLAKALDAGATVEISGVLLKNDVSVGSILTGTAVIEARFVVKKGGDTRYDKTKSATIEWESAYLASIAIPRGTENYPRVVQKLLNTLYADPTFFQALK